MALREAQMGGGIFQITVPSQHLDGAEIRAGFEQICDEAVTERVRVHLSISTSMNASICFPAGTGAPSSRA